MMGRLILAIISTLLEEVAIVAIVLWGLPRLDIEIPLWGLILIMVAWAAYSTFTHRMGTLALKRDLLVGLPNMVGCQGEVVSPLAPQGLVRIKGELWVAESSGGEMPQGKEVIVVGQQRLKLIVQGSNETNTSARS